jgi:hypothetical protein
MKDRVPDQHAKRLRRRFWVELVLALASGTALMVTLLRKDWIEVLFGVDPDSGSGELEWLIAGGLLVITVCSIALARGEWHRRSAVAG